MMIRTSRAAVQGIPCVLVARSWDISETSTASMWIVLSGVLKSMISQLNLGSHVSVIFFYRILLYTDLYRDPKDPIPSFLEVVEDSWMLIASVSWLVSKEPVILKQKSRYRRPWRMPRYYGLGQRPCHHQEARQEARMFRGSLYRGKYDLHGPCIQEARRIGDCNL